YTSTNTGTTWTLTGVPSSPSWIAAAASADGTKLAVVSQKIGIYSSTNSGATWQSNNAPTAIVWQAVASSADGNKLVTAAFNSGIWISQTTPAPRLNVLLASNSLVLSWIVPSQSFAVQQSPGLSPANWVTLSNTPMPNLTNLQ